MEDHRLEARVGEALLARSWKVCSAESCTGGLVMHRLTNIPGCSTYVLGGVVTYSNEMKEKLLGVRFETLRQYGAVSEQTAREMVEGVLRVYSADIGVSITGIAGPGGATPGKPVGLVYLAVAVPARSLLRVERMQFSGDREMIKWLSANEALNMILTASA